MLRVSDAGVALKLLPVRQPLQMFPLILMGKALPF